MKPFSDSFMAQIWPILDSQEAHSFSCLNDLIAILNDAVRKLNVTGVDNTLQIIYRKPGMKKYTKARMEASIAEVQEKNDITKAINESLQAYNSEGDAEDMELAKAIAESLLDLRPALGEPMTDPHQMNVEILAERQGTSLVHSEPTKANIEVDNSGGGFTLQLDVCSFHLSK
jgi:hypothetical protein